MPNPRARRRAGQVRPPSGRLRQSQVVTTFGPGSLYDLLDDAVLIGGLDFWRLEGSDVLVSEPRLQEAIERDFRQLGWRLSKDQPFRKPPAGDDRQPTEANGVQVLEFPRWFVCQNPKCRALVRSTSLEHVNKEYRHRCSGPEARQERCVPVRFVAACKRGHLSDINWVRWLHEGAGCGAPQLRLEEGATGDFSEIVLTCGECQKRRRLIEMLVEDRMEDCYGERPWLGHEAYETNDDGTRKRCGEKQRMLVRTASNTYFAQTMSAITIPEVESLRSRLKREWRSVQGATATNLAVLKEAMPHVKALIGSASDEEVLTAIAAERENSSEERPEIYTAEWQTFIAQPQEQPGELPTDAAAVFWARRIARSRRLPPNVKEVILAHRLRKVQAQIGFTRIEPLSHDLQGRYDLGVELAPLSLTKDWLPVTEVRGEGIFVRLDEGQVHAWETSPPVREREELLSKAWEKWRQRSTSKQPFPGVRLRCGLPRLPLHAGVLVRALQPVPRPVPGRAHPGRR